MKAVIINCFDTFDNRVKLVNEVLREKNYETLVITSDYLHVKKEYTSERREGYEYIHVKKYKNNLSLARMSSHYLFAKEVYKKIEREKPDLIYCILPANSLGKFVGKYKKNNNNVKLFFDINDMWPESFPVPLIKNIFPFSIWKSLRDQNLKYADKVITECNLFRNKIKDDAIKNSIATIYMPGIGRVVYCENEKKIEKNILRLCYLGSINNIIDIECIVDIIRSADKKVKLEIIGDGCNVDLFIEATKNAGAYVTYHGLIYDDDVKKEIMSKCHFGLNIMKSTVYVGLTMKSIEYFRFGLPIINNIKGDTWELVSKEKIGINYEYGNINKVYDDYEDMCKNAIQIYEKYFSKDIIKNELKKIIN